MAVSWGVAAAAFLAAAGSRPAWPAAGEETQQESGGTIYLRHCATCHGREAKGDGPLAKSLRVVPPDLTRIARRNRGKFDAEKVARIIDGRDLVASHGDSDMPAWGDAFKRTSEGFGEEKVKQRIKALTEHLRSLQVP